MPKFVKNPIVIEAIQFDGSLESAKEICEWCKGTVSNPNVSYMTFKIERLIDVEDFMIHTLEGDMLVSPRDWVIQGIKGEYYPCKPGIFAETYTVC